MNVDFQKLPIPVVSRMQLERSYIIAAKGIKGLICKAKLTDTSEYYPMVRNNRFYGNEYLLRRYSKVEDYLYAIIEHGLYFGNNRQKVGLKHEWELGCILTNGLYRQNLINQVFPDYFCKTIGPMIHYSRIDSEFEKCLRNHIIRGKRTLLFFPAHSTESVMMAYDCVKAMKLINQIAEERECVNVIICVNLFDFDTYQSIHYDEICPGKIVQIASNGGRYDCRFLDRQKTMISLADVTVSNQLGTQLGYCVYMKKPHILFPQDIKFLANDRVIRNEFGSQNRSENWAEDYDKEKQMFQDLFSFDKPDLVTEKQYQLCNYYWGFSQIRTPQEIKDIFCECRCKANEFIKNN